MAAVQRAQRHSRRQVPHRLIAEHLGFAHSATTTRGLSLQLKSLRAEGSLEKTRKHGQDLWSLASLGTRRLGVARRAGKVGDLPESPQHREWRHALEEAGRRIECFRSLVCAALGDAHSVVSFPIGARSERWLELSERLRWSFWLVGSATYCLEERPEPHDDHPIPDEDSEGRRTWDWDECESLARGASS